MEFESSACKNQIAQANHVTMKAKNKGSKDTALLALIQLFPLQRQR